MDKEIPLTKRIILLRQDLAGGAMIGVFSKHTGRLVTFQPNQADYETDQHGHCSTDIGVDEVEIEDKTCPQGASQAHEGVAQSPLLVQISM